ncbi:sensor histidine kinase [Paenibacillus sp. GCM10027627]|uniref:sensor histidine kinase n=1 Tax=unclassified Paenibacillus TaxID=185978 RepID=UPI00363DCE2A
MKERLPLRLAFVIIAVAAGIVLIATVSIILETHYHISMYEEQTSDRSNDHQSLTFHLEQAMIQTILWTCFGSITLAVIVGYYVAKRISRPLLDVKRVAERMKDGDWDARAEAKGDDELAQLGASLNKLAEQLQRQEKLRVAMTEDIAHELRTPLATLKSHMRALEDGVWDPTPERIHTCYEEIERLTDLVAELEDLTYVESPGFQLDLRNGLLEDVVQRAEELVSSAFREKRVELRLRLQPGVRLEMDQHRMMQILVNLLSNALKFTPSGGDVWIEAREEGRYVLLTVRDSGAGIPAEDLPNIFERFYRAEKSRNRETGGSGLGLTIVKQLVTAHGGTIRADSGSGGTAFYIRFPGKL